MSIINQFKTSVGYLLFALTVTLAAAAAQAVTVTASNNSASPSLVSPGQTDTVSTTLTSNQTLSNAEVTFDLFTSSGTWYKTVTDNYQTTLNANVPQTVKWAVPTSGMPTGVYSVEVKVRSSNFSTTYLDQSNVTRFTIGNLSVTASNSSASPATLAPGQVDTISTTLTSNQTLTNAEITFDLFNSSGTWYSTITDNYQTTLNANVPQIVTWLAPTAGMPVGTYYVEVKVRSSNFSTTYLDQRNATSFSVASACTFNGVTLANGATATGYSATTVAAGSSCSSVQETVTCSNGVLSPSNASPTCSFAAYSQASVSSGTCSSVAENVTATEGVYNPSTFSLTCTALPVVTASNNSTSPVSVAPGQSDTIRTTLTSNQTLTNAEVTFDLFNSSGTWYNTITDNTQTTLSANVPQTVTWVAPTAGMPVGTYYVEVKVRSSDFSTTYLDQRNATSFSVTNSCTFNGVTLANGATTTGYSATTVAAGSSCSSVQETVTCSNGVLSPSNASPTCSFAAYSQATVTSGTCSSVAETVTATEGVYNPSAYSLTCTTSSSTVTTVTAANNSTSPTSVVSGQTDTISTSLTSNQTLTNAEVTFDLFDSSGAWYKSVTDNSQTTLNANVPQTVTWAAPTAGMPADTYSVEVKVRSSDFSTTYLDQMNVTSFTVTAGSSGGGGGSSSGPNFPRIGGDFIGGTQAYDSTFQKFAAKLNMVIIGGSWEGWSESYSKEQVITSIKSQSHVGTKVFQYCLLNASKTPSNGPRYPTYADKVNSMGWWLYSGSVGGSIVQTGDGTDDIDMTSNSPKDPSTGFGVYQWGAHFIDSYYRLGSYQGQYSDATPTPDLDGYFLDNVMTYPIDSGDWLRNGSGQSNMNSTVDKEVMQAESTFPQYIHSVWPSAIILGNSGDNVGQGVDKGVDISPLIGQFQGGILEAAIGESWSIDTWGGSSGLMRWYTNSMNSLGGPKMQEFNVHYMTSDGRIPTSFSSGNPSSYTSAYQGLRYSLTAALMNDGYFAPINDGGRYADDTANYLWFDEYDGAGIGQGYLGQPLSTSAGAPQTGSWQNGVWKREFQNGIVLWNPKGNGSRTVNLSGLGNLKHICGSQDRNVNNCQSVTNGSITLQNEDGVILLRY